MKKSYVKRAMILLGCLVLVEGQTHCADAAPQGAENNATDSPNYFLFNPDLHILSTADTNNTVASLEGVYVRLLGTDGTKGFKGYLKLDSMLDTDSRYRLGGEAGYNFEALAGESVLSYRLLSAPVRGDLPPAREFDENATEQWYQAKHTFYPVWGFSRELGGRAYYSHLNGKDVGFAGSQMSGARMVNASGWDLTPQSLIGLRCDVEAGYENATQDNFWDDGKQRDEGFAGALKITAVTALGSLDAGIDEGPVGKVIFFGYGSDNLRLTYQNYHYNDSPDEHIVGIRLTLPVDFTGTSSESFIDKLFSVNHSLFRNEGGVISKDEVDRIARSAPTYQDHFLVKSRIQEQPSKRNVPTNGYLQ